MATHRYSRASSRVLPGVLGVLTRGHRSTRMGARWMLTGNTLSIPDGYCEYSRTVLRVLRGVHRALTGAIGALTVAALRGEPRIRRERCHRFDELRIRRREGSRHRSTPVLTSRGVAVSTHREGLPRCARWGSHAGCSEYSRLGRARRLGLERRAGRLGSCTERARSCVSGNGCLCVHTQPYLCMYAHRRTNT